MPGGTFWVLRWPGQPSHLSLLVLQQQTQALPTSAEGKERGQAARSGHRGTQYSSWQVRVPAQGRKRTENSMVLVTAGSQQLSHSMRAQVPHFCHSIMILVGGRHLGPEVGLKHAGQQSPEPKGLVCHAEWFLLLGISDRVIPVAAGRHVLEPCKNTGWNTGLRHPPLPEHPSML